MEVSSFEEVRVQKKWAKDGRVGVVTNPKFMTQARRRERERGKQIQRSEEESMSTPVVKEEMRYFLVLITEGSIPSRMPPL